MYAASRLDGLDRDLGRQVDGQRGEKGGSCGVYAEKFESRAFSRGLPKLSSLLH